MAEGSSAERARRVAALYDVHGNLPALDAVLAELAAEDPDLVVVGGDVLWGPMQAEVLERLLALRNARFVRGNTEREVAAREQRGDEQRDRWTAWCTDRLSAEQLAVAVRWPETQRVEIEGVGPALFCHGSPRSDLELLTSESSEERLAAALAGVDEPLVVCGHTHVQFDRRAAGRRIVNAGSVGMAYEGEPGLACWALLGPDVELRRTRFDAEAAAEAIRRTGMPDAEAYARMAVLEPASADEATREFERMARELGP